MPPQPSDTVRDPVITGWAGLAPVWDRYEKRGLAGEHLRLVSHWLQGEALVVGAGQGLLVEELCRLQLSAIGVDCCPAMIDAAQARRGLRLTLASANQLPFEDQRFDVVVVATGVLGPATEENVRLLRECRRVTLPAGPLVLGGFEPPMAYLSAATELGIVAEGWESFPKLLSAARTSSAQAVRGMRSFVADLALALGCSPDDPRLDQLAPALSGLVFAPGEFSGYIESLGFQVVDAYHHEGVAVVVAK